MTPTSKSLASGCTFTVPLIALEERLIFCSLPSETRPLLDAFWSVQSTCTECLRRSPSTRPAPMRRPSKVSRLTLVSTSLCAKKIPERHRGARSPSRQKNHPTDAWVQVVLEYPNPDRRYRDYAHDPHGADGLPRRSTHVLSAAALKPRCLITRSATQLFSAKLHYCDRTFFLKP